jgi:signal transduction histidine kinase
VGTSIRKATAQIDLQPVIIKCSVGGLELYADPLLERVFYNLADNAMRYGKTITEIRVRFEEKDGSLILFWEDNGIGIPASDKNAIFNRGFGKNTGLGLFLVREILSITGMTITETGVPGHGTRFEIAVPAGAYRLSHR